MAATGDDGSWRALRPQPLTEDEGRRLQDLGYRDDGEPSYAELRDLTGGAGRLAGVSVYPDTAWEGDDGFEPPWELIGFLASVLVALAVIGVASALAAADGRPDELIVAAVGAPPGVVRRRRVLEATFTAAAAAVLGGGLGAVATLTVIHSPFVSEDGVPPLVRFPLLQVVGVTGGTVAVVGGVTWLALAVSAAVRGRRGTCSWSTASRREPGRGTTRSPGGERSGRPASTAPSAPSRMDRPEPGMSDAQR